MMKKMATRWFVLVMASMLLALVAMVPAFADPPDTGPAEVLRYSIEDQACAFPWFDPDGNMVWLDLAEHAVNANDANGNKLVWCRGPVDFAQLASLSEACAYWEATFGVSGICNGPQQGAMVFTGTKTGLPYYDVDENDAVEACTYNWTSTVTPAGKVNVRISFNPRSNLPADQCP